MIYKMNNNSDIHKILKYGKARGAYMLHTLLPSLSDVNNLYVLNSYEDYKQIVLELPSKVILRADAEIGTPPTLGIRGCALLKEKIPDYIELVKKTNPNGVVLCIDTKIENKKTIISGSFNVHFECYNCIIVEYLGQGFDIGGITKGEDIHETYYIPWDEVLFAENMNRYLKYKITDEEYETSAKRKIEYLIANNELSKEQAIQQIPTTYHPISNEIHRMIYNEIIIPILANENITYKLGSSSFGIQGMIREDSEKNYILQPVEIRTSKRHVEEEFYNKYLASKEKKYYR